MIDLERQLRNLGEAHDGTWGALDADDILTPKVVTQPIPGFRARKVLIGIATAAITLALIGLLPVLLFGDDPGPADPAVSTTAVVPTTTPAVPTTAAVPTTVPPVATTVPVPTTVVAPAQSSSGPLVVEGLWAELGAFEWVTLEFDAETWPSGGFTYDPETGYRSEGADGRVWRSGDGFEWIIEYHEQEQRTIADLPEPAEVDGLATEFFRDRVVVSGESAFVNGQLSGSIEWREVVESAYYWYWDEGAQELELQLDGDEVVRLLVSADGERVVFRDSTTGAVIHTVAFSTSAAAERFSGDPSCLARSCVLGTPAWVSQSGGPFEIIDVPGGGREIAAIPSGGFAYLHPESGDLMVSSDGRDWEPSGFTFEGIPKCLEQLGLDYLNLDGNGGGGLMSVSFACNSSESTYEEWWSADGLNWAPFPGPATEFGLVRGVDDPSGHGTDVQVSIDGGATWASLPRPASFPPDPGEKVESSGGSGLTAAGDLIFFTYFQDSSYWMSVGRFERSN